jgi:hypothetical protein
MKVIRPARHYRIVMIQADDKTLIAAEPLPDDCADAPVKVNSPVSAH